MDSLAKSSISPTNDGLTKVLVHFCDDAKMGPSGRFPLPPFCLLVIRGRCLQSGRLDTHRRERINQPGRAGHGGHNNAALVGRAASQRVWTALGPAHVSRMSQINHLVQLWRGTLCPAAAAAAAQQRTKVASTISSAAQSREASFTLVGLVSSGRVNCSPLFLLARTN